MKKIINISLILAIVLCTCTSFTYSIGFNHIIAKNDESATVSKGYPVISVTNTTNTDLLVNYNFHISDPDSPNFEQVSKDILIKANSTIVLELPQLSFLGETGDVRRIWFSWNEEGILKPLDTSIDTFSFKSVPHTELGMN